MLDLFELRGASRQNRKATHRLLGCLGTDRLSTLTRFL
jgi:hypothetical protein